MQPVEVQVHDVKVLGWCDPLAYPMPKGKLTPEQLRSHQHLRMRTNLVSVFFMHAVMIDCYMLRLRACLWEIFMLPYTFPLRQLVRARGLPWSAASMDSSYDPWLHAAVFAVGFLRCECAHLLLCEPLTCLLAVLFLRWVLRRACEMHAHLRRTSSSTSVASCTFTRR